MKEEPGDVCVPSRGRSHVFLLSSAAVPRDWDPITFMFNLPQSVLSALDSRGLAHGPGLVLSSYDKRTPGGKL